MLNAFIGSASQSKALPQWPHRKASHGQVKVGHGVQRIPCISRWIHESTGKHYIYATLCSI